MEPSSLAMHFYLCGEASKSKANLLSCVNLVVAGGRTF